MNKFNALQVAALRASFDKLSGFPASRVGELRAMVEKMSDPVLEQVARARIKFLSAVAVNEQTRRAIKRAAYSSKEVAA